MACAHPAQGSRHGSQTVATSRLGYAPQWPGRATDASAWQPGQSGAGPGDPGAAVPGATVSRVTAMKIAANLSLLFTELPLRERVVAAAAAGFDGVEIQFPYELPAVRLKEALEAAGMPLGLINLPAGDLLGGGAGLAAVPARQAEFAAALQEALSYAAMVRPAWVNVLPGRLAAGVDPEQALACLQANLRQAAEAFELLGIGVLVEAINPLDMPGFLIKTPEQLAANR